MKNQYWRVDIEPAHDPYGECDGYMQLVRAPTKQLARLEAAYILHTRKKYFGKPSTYWGVYKIYKARRDDVWS